MAESLICASDGEKSRDGLSVSAPKDALFKRRIEFHLARKPFNPYSSHAESDFHLETLNPSSDSQLLSSSSAGPSGSTAKKSDGGGEFFEHGVDPELTFETTFRRIGAGLANLGNTCFLNSVLQCLTYTEPFAAYLQSGKHKSSCHTAGFCALCAIQNHVRSALQSTGKILSPFHLVKNLRCISRNFRNSRQEDAHECMVNLLESMHKCCLPSGVSSESPSAYEKSLVHKIFGGHLRSQVKCMQCSYCSNKFDPFLDLSLEIVKADSLRKALAHFTATEQLDGGERQYQCQRCKEKVKALKQLTVHKAPYVLTIHLKRFGSDVPGQKIDRRVEFGPNLDLKPFVSGPYEGSLKYTLYGVLVHAGWSTHSGHYYCFVRTSSGMWYSLDDNRVFQVSERTVLEQKAYMLFYVRDRRSTVAPKKPLDVVHIESMASNTTRNKEVPISSMGSKEAIANGQMERSSDALKCASLSRTLPVSSHCQPISSAVTSLKEPITKESSGCQNKDQVSAEVTQRSTQLEKPVPSLNSTLLKKPPVLDVRSLPKSVPPTENGSVTTSTIGDTTFATKNAKNTLRSEHRTFDCHSQGSGGDSSIMVAQRNDCNGIKNSKKLPKENGVHENGDTVNERIPCNSPCKVRSNTKSVVVSEIKPSSQSSTSNGFIHKKSYDAISGQQNCGMLNEKDPLDLTRLVRIGDDHPSAKPELKPKRLGKAPMMRGMCLGPKRRFLAYLSLRKKKKHKQSKKHILDGKILSKKDILGDYKSNDPGTSTSVKDRTADCVLIQHKKQRRHDKLKKVNTHKASKRVKDDNSLEIKDRGPEDRSGPDLAVLATHQLLEKSSISEENRCDLQDKRGLVQNGMMSILTRGLEMPTVARWDDIESPSSETFGIADAQNNSIGYVLDEWDEEYDRGKRKKVRKPRSFDGKNPFQEFSDKMTQKKTRMTMDRSSAGNQPFRI